MRFSMHYAPRFALAVTFITLSLVRCECSEDDISRVAPKIYIGKVQTADQRAADADLESYCETEGWQDCTFGFGDVAVGEGGLFTFELRNPSPVALQIESITIEEASDENTFKVTSAVPEEIVPDVDAEAVGDSDDENAEAPQGITKITVGFTPLTTGPKDAVIVIKSDAANVTPGEDVRIEISGNGIDTGRPKIEIVPPSCDFGPVGASTTAFCDLTVKNVGQKVLSILGGRFGDDTPSPDVFNAETALPLAEIVPGALISLRLSATPPDASSYEGELIISSTDPNTPDSSVPLIVDGEDAPTAVPDVLSIDDVSNSDGADGFHPNPLIRPYQNVVLTSERSSSPNGAIVGYQWEIIEPEDGDLGLTDPTGPTTGFTFQSGSTTNIGLPVAGTYVVKLTVTDDVGYQSANDGKISLTVVPDEALHVQMSWDSPNYDFDLHMIRTDVSDYCSAQSCYYANCSSNYDQYAEWDGVQGQSAGDATLDLDDLSGYGPENINVDEPLDGTYEVAVHAYSSSLGEPVDVSVKVFINGALAHEDFRTMADGRELWRVAQVQFQSGTAIIFPMNVTDDNFACTGGGFPF